MKVFNRLVEQPPLLYRLLFELCVALGLACGKSLGLVKIGSIAAVKVHIDIRAAHIQAKHTPTAEKGYRNVVSDFRWGGLDKEDAQDLYVERQRAALIHTRA